MAGVQKPKIQWAISLLLMMLYFYGSPAQAQYGGGSGTAEDPYLIYTAEQMNEIGLNKEDWDKHFELMVDIDLTSYTGTNFNIIPTFTGVFDGNGHTISNFSYTSTYANRIGLFGDVSGDIKDLGLIAPHVDAGTGRRVGSLIGGNSGAITNCYVEGGSVVAGRYDVGGLVGENYRGTITNCYATGSVTGNEGAGGLVGTSLSGTITNCYSTGSVSGGDMIGGLVGFNVEGTITSSYATGSVSGNQWVAGLVGYNGGLITNCYATGTVSGENKVGGLVGQNGDAWLADEFFSGTISNCYSTGSVSGTTDDGGLVGLDYYGWFSNSFWDIQTSRQIISAGGTGKTTAEMQIAITFLNARWDFVDETENGTDDIWWILEGKDYPRLWWQLFWAVSPYPQDGSTDVTQPLLLRWAPGVSALYHDVYFGEDKDAVKNATTDSPEYKGSRDLGSESYDPGKLALDTTYYWRIDEANLADPNSPWKGNVWSFTTANFLIVDDFDSYFFSSSLLPGTGNSIWDTWIDGYDDPTNGSLVGNDDPSLDFCEQTIVRSGRQSMPLYYDNSVVYSEATADIANLEIDRDWTKEGIRVLSLWFYGVPNNAPEPMYVALANVNGSTTVVYHDNPDAPLIEAWTEWRIDLQAFTEQGVDLTNINTITIGFGNRNNPQPGGWGQMYFDDIGLYRPRPEPEQEPEPAP